MKILKIQRATAKAKIGLTLGEIIFIINAIFEYCENHNISKNVCDNPTVNNLYYNLSAIRDVLKYGEVTVDTVRFWNRDLSAPTKAETEEEVEF